MWEKSKSNRAFLLFEIVVALGLLAIFVLVFGRFCRLADKIAEDCQCRNVRIEGMSGVVDEEMRRVYLA